jgi:predicted MFS family arabinose efflux permease
MRATGRRYGFLTAAAATAVTLWASASSSMNYPLYAEHWQLEPWVTTLMYAAYPLALIPMLLLFGNLSDHLGRRTMMLCGLAAIIAGGIVLGVAPWVWTVFLGRVLLGVGVGLALSPATAAVMEFGGPDGARRAGSTVSAATAVGLTLAMFIGGALIEFGPAPMVLNQWVLVLVTLVVFVLALWLPRHSPDPDLGRWRPRGIAFPRQGGARFAAGILGVVAGYVIGVIFIGLGAAIAKSLLHTDDVFVGGTVIAVSTAAVGITSLLIRKARPLPLLAAGLAASALSMVALIASGITASLPLFFVSSLASGIAYAFLVSGGLGLVGTAAAPTHRAATVSTAYFFGYAAQAGVAIWLGAVETAAGFPEAVAIGAVLVVVPAIVAVILAARRRAPRPVAVATATARP